MSIQWERIRDGGSTDYDRWKSDDGRGDDPEAAARVDAMNLHWHQGHDEHEPGCHLCRELQRLREAYRQPVEDDLQQEYVRPKREVA